MRSNHAWIALAGLTGSLLLGCGPDLSRFEAYREPKIETWTAKNMLTVELKGKPSETAGRAMGALFKAFHKLDGADQGVDDAGRAPRARWQGGPDVPETEWVGRFGLQLSETIKELPADFATMDPPLRLESWSYGEVAVLLHVGGYDKEKPDIDRLHGFIAQQGRIIAGSHEEIYLKGPGWIFEGDPASYQTLLLYPVATPTQPPAETAPAAPATEPTPASPEGSDSPAPPAQPAAP